MNVGCISKGRLLAGAVAAVVTLAAPPVFAGIGGPPAPMPPTNELFGVSAADGGTTLPAIHPGVTLTYPDGTVASADSPFYEAAPNFAGTLNGVTYQPSAFGGAPGGATGWVNSSFVIPEAGNYRLAFWVSDFDDDIVESALGIDNVSLSNSTTSWIQSFEGLDPLSSGIGVWERHGTGGESGFVTEILSPPDGDQFSFIDTLAGDDGEFGEEGPGGPGDDGEFLVPLIASASSTIEGVNTSQFGGTLGSVLLSPTFAADADSTISFDANFLTTDGDGFYDFAIAQLVAGEIVVGTVLSGNCGDDPDCIPDTVIDVDYDLSSATTLYTADAGDSITGLGQDDPFLPTIGPDGEWIFPEVEVTPDVWWWFDPEYATGYDYGVAGDAFTKIFLPLDLIGDNCYYITYEDPINGTMTTGCVSGGVEYDLETELGIAGGLMALTVNGIEVESMLDPTDTMAFVTGFQFASGGTVQFSQNPITTFVSNNVPEPATVLLLGAALAGLGARTRRRRTR